MPIDFHWKVPFILLINYSIMFIKFGNQIGVEMIMWLKIWFVYNPVRRKMKEIRHYHLEGTNCVGLEFFQEHYRKKKKFSKIHNKHGYVKALIEHTFIVWSYDTLKFLTITPRKSLIKINFKIFNGVVGKMEGTQLYNNLFCPSWLRCWYHGTFRSIFCVINFCSIECLSWHYYVRW